MVYDDGAPTTLTAMMTATTIKTISKIFVTASDTNFNQFRFTLTRICA
jgi:hypothetical protein